MGSPNNVLRTNNISGNSCNSCGEDPARSSPATESDFSDVVYLLFLMIVGLALRLDFVLPANSVIDADEAIVGLMARHLLAGADIPIFYYGQHYMGSLEAIITAGMFYLFGESSFTLKLTPLIFSITLIPLMFALTKQYTGSRGARFAALLMAIPPVGLVIWSTKARGGFIEILVIGALALFFSGKLLLNCRRGYFNPKLLAAACGFLGLGWWVNNQIVFFFIPVGIILFNALWKADRAAPKDLVKHLFVGAVAFFLGGAPFWLYNIQHGFVSFGLFSAARGSSVAEHINGLISVSLPILIGSKHFWDTNNIFPNATLYFSAIYFVALAATVLAAVKPLSQATEESDKLSPWYPIILVFSTLAIFSFSSFGYLVQAPRYLLPTYVGLFLIAGIGLERIGSFSNRITLLLVGLLLTQNMVSAYYSERALPGEPMIFNGDRVARDNLPLTDFLKQKGISLVRTNYWVGYRLAFETAEQIKFLVYQEPRSVRIPEYEKFISDSNRQYVPLVLSPKQADIVDHGLHSMGYQFKRESVGSYEVFYELVDQDQEQHEIPRSAYSIDANFNADAAPLAVDGDPHTRWGSAHPQTPGMFVEISFSKPTVVGGIVMDTFGFDSDRAKKLEIRGYGEDNHEILLFNQVDYKYAQYADDGALGFRFVFEPQLLTRIKLIQLGEDPVFDWSITELTPLTN